MLFRLRLAETSYRGKIRENEVEFFLYTKIGHDLLFFLKKNESEKNK